MDKQEKVNAWLDRQPTFVLFGIFLLITLLQLAVPLICLGASILYAREGKFDFFAIWLMFAALNLPQRKK